jgi:hypothetical protein
MLTHLDAAIDALHALDLDDLSDPQLHSLVVGLEQRCSRLAAARARVPPAKRAVRSRRSAARHIVC